MSKPIHSGVLERCSENCSEGSPVIYKGLRYCNMECALRHNHDFSSDTIREAVNE